MSEGRCAKSLAILIGPNHPKPLLYSNHMDPYLSVVWFKCRLACMANADRIVARRVVDVVVNAAHLRSILFSKQPPNYFREGLERSSIESSSWESASSTNWANSSINGSTNWSVSSVSST